MDLNYFQLLKTYIIVPNLPMSIISIWQKLSKQNIYLELNNLPLKLDSGEYEYYRKKIKSFAKKRSLRETDLTDYIWHTDFDEFEENWDTATSYFNLEMTYPMVDRRVVECLLEIPIEHFIADGMYRGLIKKAMKNIVPDLILNRNDKGFYSPGHVQIILKDLPEIITLFENNLDIIKKQNTKIDINQIIENLRNICKKDKNDNTFVTTEWNTIEISIWILFNLNFENYGTS